MDRIDAPARRAVHSIDHYALTVPDLDQAAHFLDAFGLHVERVDGRLDVYAADGHCWARFYPGERKQLAYLSLSCHAADFDGLCTQLEREGATLLSGAQYGGDGIWCHDADGNLLQVKVGPKTSPDAKSPVSHAVAPGGQRGAAMRSQVAKVHPRRLSHVLLFSPDVPRIVAFYERALGLRLSDRSGDIIAFTHTPHGSDHHLIAFAHSAARGWHHAAWDVASVNEVGQGATQMANAGYTRGWGTGRHVLGSNYFFYVLDPWGSFCEFSADIDHIPAGVDWPAGDFPPEDSLYQWGPDVPDYFIHNTEA